MLQPCRLAQFGRADPGRAGNQLISRDIAVFQRNARGIHTDWPAG
jgi:hypothetical protein